MITLSHYLVLGAILFSVSIAGIFLNRKNIIIILMSIELMLLAVNMNFIAFSHYLGDLSGQIFVFFILTVAAAEAAIGLAILVVLFKELLINLDNNIQNRKLEEQNNVKNEVIDIQPKGIESIINMEGLSNVYTNLGNNLKDCEKCVEYEDCENCEDCVENKDLCPNIIDEETKEDCKKYTNDSIIFNTFRVIKKKVYKFFVYVGKSIYDFFY